MSSFKKALAILFHPVRGFVLIKEDREHFNYFSIGILFLLIMVARIIDIYFMHYPLATMQARETNIGLELARMLIPLITWSIGCYAMTTIMEGKTLFIEQLASTAYAMLPYIVLTPIYVVLSYFMSRKDAALFYNLQVFKWGWVVLLFFIATATMNEYRVGKTIGVCLLSGLTVVIVWLLCGLFYALTDQVLVFFKELYTEIKLIFLK